MEERETSDDQSRRMNEQYDHWGERSNKYPLYSHKTVDRPSVEALSITRGSFMPESEGFA